MALRLIPPLAAASLVDTTPNPADRVIRRPAFAFLGRGLIRPFRRDEKNDFSNAEGETLVRACVGQILTMQASSPRTVGELPWDPTRGSLLHLLRHQNNDDVLRQLARLYVGEALAKYEPRVRLRALQVTAERGPDNDFNVLLIRLAYDFIAANSPTNQVLLSGVKQTVDLLQSAA